MARTLWQRLQAAAAALGHSQARIISDALESYFASLSAEDRELIDTIIARHRNK